MGTVEAVVNHDVETLAFRMEDPGAGKAAETAALESILWTLTAHAPAEIRRNPLALREAAGSRPHQRGVVTAKARAGGIATVELRWMEGGADDVKRGEGVDLDKRRMKLVAARVLRELVNR